jgi:hypothetical protein
MTTQVVISFTATAAPTVLTSALVSALAAVSLPTGDLGNIGLSIISDTTAAGVGTATRTVTFSTLPIFKSNQPVGASCSGGCYISVVSSSDQDAVGGSGASIVEIPYLDPDGKPHTIRVALKGTKVASPPPRDIVSLSGPITVVQGNANVGLISILLGKTAVDEDDPAVVTSLPSIGQLLGNFQGSIVSTSVMDTATGIGGQSVLISYTDRLSGAHTEAIGLLGQVAVNLANLDHAIITNMALTASGSFGSSGGIISVYSGPAVNGVPTGALIAQLQSSFFSYFNPQTIVAPALDLGGNIAFGNPTKDVSPSPADQTGPLRELYAQALSAAIGSQVTSAAPVFS